MSNYYSVISMKEFRKTNKVSFYNVPMVEGMKAIDLVMHESEAFSPGQIKDVERPWYYHPHQIDNLFVTFGVRTVDLYKIGNKKIETFEVTPNSIKKFVKDKNNRIVEKKILSNEPAILRWETNVFHRVHTGKEGSASVNLAVRLEGIDMKTNFNIYKLDTEKNTFEIIRKGFEDQS